MSYVIYMNEWCRTYEWVTSHTWMRHVTRVKKLSHTYERIMSRIWMSHVANVNGSCRTCECVMSHTHETRHYIICGTWLIHMRDATHSQVWHDSSTSVTWLKVWHDSFICWALFIWVSHNYPVRWRGGTREATEHAVKKPQESSLRVSLIQYIYIYIGHSFICVTWFIKTVGHDAFIRVTWLIYMCDMTHSYFSSTCETWLICMLRLPHVYLWYINMVGYDAFIRVTWLIHTCVCDMTHSFVWHASFHVTHPYGHDSFI